MKKTKNIILSVGLSLSGITSAQNINLLKEIAQDISYNGNNKIEFFRLKSDQLIYQSNAKNFIEQNILPSGFVLKIKSTEQDEIGYTHTKYEVLYNNNLINNKAIIAHCLNGKVVSINGDLENYQLPTNSISIDSNSALDKALAKVNAKTYMWENTNTENVMRKALNDPEFSFKPKGELVVYNPYNTNEYKYSYKFNIYAAEPLYRANVFVDADNGSVIAEENLIHHIDVPSMATTRFSGTQNFTTDSVSPGLYRLLETGRGLGIETYNLSTGTNYSAAINYTNTTNSWTTTTIQQVGTDAHWGAEMVYDYYLSEHNRNSIDNAGFKLISFADYGVGYANAFWNGVCMTYGSGSNGGFTGLDICGHEVTHGLTSKTSGLVYSNESGALNESYSDIFGVCIEKFGKPSAFNWTMGEDVGGIRSMSNPNSFGQPDTYLGTSWYTGSGDNGGVHTNSGVSNFWFYLLCQGGTGVNDKANSFTVSAIGMTKAAKIAFRSNTFYFTPNTNYITARNLSIQAATDLYGACSNEVYQTKCAWYAVGVGPSPSGTATPISNFTSMGSSPCSIPFNVNFVNTSYGSDTYVWDFGDGSAVSTATNPVHSYTANGTYSVKLKAISACAVNPDSIIKSNYIVVNALSSSSVVAAMVCDSGKVVLSASGTDQQYWYNNPTASGTALYVGTSFTTPVINSNTTYYVVNTATNPVVYGGPLTNTIGSGANFPGNSAYDSLNVIQPCTLKSVVVYAGTTASRVIELRNSMNTVLASTTVNLTAGTNTVTLNFNLTPGYGYRLGLGPSTAQLYRNNGGVTYPYNISNLLSITGSSGGSSTFFFFYNWEVAPNDCKGAPTAVTASVNTAPSVSVVPSSTMACITDGLVSINATPSGGTLIGTGVSGSSFNPSVGSGTYAVTYSLTDANGCSNTNSVSIVVSPCIGINEYSLNPSISVFPNPFSEIITINGTIEDGSVFVITDALGATKMTQKASIEKNQMNLSELAAGIYFLNIKSNKNEFYRCKIIKQ